MRILFLDIDGVLNNDSSLSEGIHLIPEKIVMIRELCIELDLYIVISSSWRILLTLNEIQKIFRLLGFSCTNRIIDITRKSKCGELRGNQIEDWLLDNPQVHKYVIIDDDSDMLEYQKEQFIHINHHVGLCYKDISLIKSKFLK